jgi:phenylalanine-4-hydroxylase
LPGVPSIDWTIDQGITEYTAEDHRTWVTLYERQAALLPGRACDEFLAGLETLDLHGTGIPDFCALSEKLQAVPGWRVVAVPGLAPDDVFFEHLANRRPRLSGRQAAHARQHEAILPAPVRGLGPPLPDA